MSSNKDLFVKRRRCYPSMLVSSCKTVFAKTSRALQKMIVKYSAIVLCCFIVATLQACVSTTNSNAMFSTVRSYPMGPSQYMVSCVDSPGYCARESTKLCPQGFDVTSNTTNPSDYGRMTMIIKCH